MTQKFTLNWKWQSHQILHFQTCSFCYNIAVNEMHRTYDIKLNKIMQCKQDIYKSTSLGRKINRLSKVYYQLILHLNNSRTSSPLQLFFLFRGFAEPSNHSFSRQRRQATMHVILMLDLRFFIFFPNNQ